MNDTDLTKNTLVCIIEIERHGLNAISTLINWQFRLLHPRGENQWEHYIPDKDNGPVTSLFITRNFNLPHLLYLSPDLYTYTFSNLNPEN